MSTLLTLCNRIIIMEMTYFLTIYFLLPVAGTQYFWRGCRRHVSLVPDVNDICSSFKYLSTHYPSIILWRVQYIRHIIISEFLDLHLKSCWFWYFCVSIWKLTFCVISWLFICFEYIIISSIIPYIRLIWRVKLK